jgi:hypothetical protein
MIMLSKPYKKTRQDLGPYARGLIKDASGLFCIYKPGQEIHWMQGK